MDFKNERTGLELKFFELTNKILNELENSTLVLYELEWNTSSGILCVFIMNKETKTALIEDCLKVDRAFTPYMETENWIPENFTLEVSSPGLFRGLYIKQHFIDVVGEEILLNLNKKIEEDTNPNFPKVLRNNLKIKVKLINVLEEEVEVQVKDVCLKIPFSNIKKANLETNINSGLIEKN